MRKKGWAILALAAGMLLASGVPFPAVTAVQADPGCANREGCRAGCDYRGECRECPGCRCGSCCGKGAAQETPPCKQDDAPGAPRGGMHRMMHGDGAPAMRKAMGEHLEEMRGTIAKLRALETKMEALTSKDDAAAFRAASLEHSRLLADLQDSHLKHMEGMTGGK